MGCLRCKHCAGRLLEAGWLPQEGMARVDTLGLERKCADGTSNLEQV